jgi:outer membrane protein assembly factor BamB
MIFRNRLLWALPVLIGVGLALTEHWLKQTPAQPTMPQVVWVFSPQYPGAMVSSPLVAGGRVYAGVIRDNGLHPDGIVYALDAETGKPIWQSNADGNMIHMFSSPCIADGLLYIGEGMHANFDCKLSCIDVQTGQIRWRFAATSHIESSPCADGSRIFFGAGDDGVYAVDAQSGAKLWQFNERLHIDASPAVADGRVFVGSGLSRRFRTNEILALAAESGKPIWRTTVDLPAWGSPVVSGNQVFFGLGNGRLERSDPSPAGSVICVNAATGKENWRCRVPDAVLSRAAVDDRRVYFGCRDKRVYAANRENGLVTWHYEAGSEIVTTPALVGGRLYVAASAGRIVSLDTESGQEISAFDLAEYAKTKCRVWSSPSVRKDENGHERLFVGAELQFPDRSEANLLCIRF